MTTDPARQQSLVEPAEQHGRWRDPAATAPAWSPQRDEFVVEFTVRRIRPATRGEVGPDHAVRAVRDALVLTHPARPRGLPAGGAGRLRLEVDAFAVALVVAIPRVVLNPVQARQLLAAVTYVTATNRTFGERGERLRAFFACMYYAGLRPGEASYLRREDCTLPDSGWGELLLSGSMAKAKKGYTDGIDDPYRRPLKRRRRGDVRLVPAAPALVAILREHLERYGTADDGRLFPAAKTGGPMDTEVRCRVWREARKIGLSPELGATPLAARPYDLRHAALSSWLNAGVPPSEVAARAGHSVAVLLSVYAKSLDGQRDTFNARIRDLLDPGA